LTLPYKTPGRNLQYGINSKLAHATRNLSIQAEKSAGFNTPKNGIKDVPH
jgi:hypothetical protein